MLVSIENISQLIEILTKVKEDFGNIRVEVEEADMYGMGYPTKNFYLKVRKVGRRGKRKLTIGGRSDV